MKINQRIVSKFQDGGAAPAGGAPQGGAPAPGGAPGADPSQGGGQDPVMQLAQLAQQALQSQDCQAALAVCQGFMSLIQSSQGGGGQQGAPADGSGGAPASGDPSQGGGQPVYRVGGKLVRRIRA